MCVCVCVCLSLCVRRWLTVIAMAAAPSLLPEHLTVQGEGLLVIALVAGLLAGALLGWLWLIPGGF